MSEFNYLADNWRFPFFGDWDAPITDNGVRIPTPVGEKCIWCEETIIEGEAGGIYIDGHITHKECNLRQTMGGIGHLVDHGRYCREAGPDAGLSHRQSALLVWRWFVHNEHITKGELIALILKDGRSHARSTETE